MNYTATFKDGETITRTSKREYCFAWKVTYEGREGAGRFVETGFSKNEPKLSVSWGYQQAVSTKTAKLMNSGEKLKKILARKAEIKKTAEIEIVKLGA